MWRIKKITPRAVVHLLNPQWSRGSKRVKFRRNVKKNSIVTWVVRCDTNKMYFTIKVNKQFFASSFWVCYSAVNEKVCPTCAKSGKDYTKAHWKTGQNQLSLLILLTQALTIPTKLFVCQCTTTISIIIIASFNIVHIIAKPIINPCQYSST